MFNDPSFSVSRFGERGKRDATVDFITGKAVVPGHARVSLGGGRYIRINAEVWARLSKAEKDAIREQAAAQFESAPAVEAAPAPADAYDGMTADELRAEVTRRGLDAEGARSKSQIVSRLRLNDVQTRFAEPAQGEG